MARPKKVKNQKKTTKKLLFYFSSLALAILIVVFFNFRANANSSTNLTKDNSLKIKEYIDLKKEFQNKLAKKKNLSNQVINKIPEGMRAITVRVDSESSVEGWAHPGAFVDVIVIQANSSTASGLEAAVIAENIKILSAERSTKLNTGEVETVVPPTTVTLLTTQDDALRIKAAQNYGKLTFALRGSGDSAPTSSKGYTKDKTKIKENIIGRAKGPDGDNFILDKEKGWIKLER